MSALLHVWAAVGRRNAGDQQGASLVEYALLIALIAIACVVALQFLGSSVSSQLSHAGSGIAH